MWVWIKLHETKYPKINSFVLHQGRFASSHKLKNVNTIHKSSSEYWEDQSNIEQFLRKLQETMNLKTANDWNKIKRKDIQKHGGDLLLKKYSIFDLKCIGCPEGQNIFNSPPKPPGFWSKEENIKNFLLDLKKQLKIKTPGEWNKITKNHIKSNGGHRLLQKYSMFELKSKIYPENSNLFKPTRKSVGYWDKKENINQFLNKLKEKYNLKTKDDWEKLNHKEIQINGGARLLKKYSIYKLKSMGYPEYQFKSTNKPKGYWNNRENIDHFLEKLKENLNLHTKEDWDKVTTKDIEKNRGNRLLEKYSLHELKSIGFPDGKFNDHSLDINHQNIHQFLNELKEKLNLKSENDWDNITMKQIKFYGGNFLLKKYSLLDIKLMGFPNGHFNENKIKPKGYWNNKENIAEFLNQLKENLNLNTKEDWNKITTKQIKFYGGNSLLQKYSLFSLKCLGFPSGVDYFIQCNPKSVGYWENKENINQFLDQFKRKIKFKNI